MDLRVASLLVPLLVFACSSSTSPEDERGSESPTDPTNSAASSCTCSVTINGVEKNLTCGEETCLGGSTYRCVDGRGVERGAACSASSKPAKSSAPDSSKQSPTPAPKPGASTCAPPSCETDSDCKVHSASWRCFELGALGDRRACFNSDLPFGPSGGTCSDGSSTAIHTQCEDGKIAVCVPPACQTTEQKPHAAQRRKCY